MLPQAAEYEMLAMASTPSLFCSEMHIEGDLNLTDNNVQESKELSRLLWKFFRSPPPLWFNHVSSPGGVEQTQKELSNSA